MTVFISKKLKRLAENMFVRHVERRLTSDHRRNSNVGGLNGIMNEMLRAYMQVKLEKNNSSIPETLLPLRMKSRKKASLFLNVFFDGS